MGDAWAADGNAAFLLKLAGLSGGLAYLITAAASLLCAALGLLLVDGSTWLLRSAKQAKAMAKPSGVRRLDSLREVTVAGLISMWPAVEEDKTAPAAAADGAEMMAVDGNKPASGRAACPHASGETTSRASFRVQVASLRRPNFESILAESIDAHPEAHIVGAGPDVQLASLDRAITALRAKQALNDAPIKDLVRLTRSM